MRNFDEYSIGISKKSQKMKDKISEIKNLLERCVEELNDQEDLKDEEKLMILKERSVKPIIQPRNNRQSQRDLMIEKVSKYSRNHSRNPSKGPSRQLSNKSNSGKDSNSNKLLPPKARPKPNQLIEENFSGSQFSLNSDSSKKKSVASNCKFLLTEFSKIR